jgi:crossover junction endodeoxyribonuclease RuvC
MLAAAKAGLEVHEFPPAEIKKAVTGSGGASKEQVQFMVARLLRLKTVPEPADAADGVAAALAVVMRGNLPRIDDVKISKEGMVDLPRSLRVIR